MPQDNTEKLPLKVGTKVRIAEFPRSSDPFNSMDFNGLVGEVIQAYRVGFGLGNLPVYAYDVYFKEVTIPTIRRGEDGRLIREKKVTDARNYFEESYLKEV